MLSTCPIVGFIPVTDFARARAFYEGVLKLQFEAQDEHSVDIRSNGTMIQLVKLDEFTPTEFTILGWEASDIVATVEDLAKAGVEMQRYDYFEQDTNGIWTADSGDKIAWFKDPDGNILSVSQHVTAKA